MHINTSYKSLFFFTILLFCLWGVNLSAGKSKYTCYRLKKAPHVDGQLNDPVWKNIPEINGFFLMSNGESVPSYSAIPKQSSFRIGWTNKAIYIAFRAEELEINKLKSKAIKKDGGPLYKGEHVEIFIVPENSETYMQFIVNILGFRWNALGEKAKALKILAVGNWKAKAFFGKHFYSIEIKIPFSLFNQTPSGGSLWKANVCRSFPNSSWSPTLTMNGFAKDFGTILFKNKNLSPDEAKKIEIYINSSYRKHVYSILKRTASNYSEFKKYFLMMSSDPKFKKEADILQKEWDRLNIIIKNKEILKGLWWVDSLGRRSENLKGRFLLNKLFE